MDKKRLAEEIRFELDQLNHMAGVARQLVGLPEKERRPWDAAAAAKYISDLMAGLENLCKRRNSAMGIKMPKGPNYHQLLLEDFISDMQLGGRMVTESIFRLKRYLRFRHRFIHGYGHEITWDIVEEPLAQLPAMIEELASVWERWLSELHQ